MPWNLPTLSKHNSVFETLSVSKSQGHEKFVQNRTRKIRKSTSEPREAKKIKFSNLKKLNQKAWYI